MERMKKWISKGLFVLLAMLMVVMPLTGCNADDAEKALDVAIEVLEVVESLDAEMTEAGDNDVGAETISSISEQSEEKKDAETDKIIAETDKTIADVDKVIAERDKVPAETEQTVAETEQKEQPQETGNHEEELAVTEDGHYTSKEEVALYIHQYGTLPANYITKKEAENLGWKQKQGEAGQLHVVAPGMSIGGSKFGNYEGLLPEQKGRQYYECDINYKKGNRGAERIVYSNDGLIFYTGDHYESFEQLYPKE